MDWRTAKNIKHIFNVFKRLKNQIWTNDIEVLKELNEWLENAAESKATDNILFLKLVCVVLKERSEHYGCVKMAIRTINDDLSTPKENLIEMLRISLNNTDRINFLKECGIDVEGYGDETEKLTKFQKEFTERLTKNWSIKNVRQSLYKTVNQFVTDIDNYL